MKFDITHQSPFATLVALFVMSVIGACALMNIDNLGGSTIVSESLLGGGVTSLQQAHHVLCAIFCSVVIFCTTIWFGHIITAVNLYSISSTIHLFAICATLWCSVLSQEFLLCTLVACLSAYVVGSLLLSVRNHNMAHIFNSMLALSVLPMLYSPSIVLWFTTPLIWFMVRITLRELIVSISGLLLPLLGVIYIYWLHGADFEATILSLLPMLKNPSSLFSLEAVPLFNSLIVALILLLSLLALPMIPGNIHRTFVRFYIIIIFTAASLLSLLVPSASLTCLALVAPVLSALCSYRLANMRGTVPSVIYIMIWLLLLGAMFVPLYLGFEPLGVMVQ